MVTRKELQAYLDNLLILDKFSADPSNNGLQVEGCEEISKAIFAVDASATLFDAAADLDADFIFVHHGISWGSGFKRFTGITASRLRQLLANDMSLYAAHLPLDAHPEYGHNAQLADMIALESRKMFCEYAGTEIGVAGTLPEPVSVESLAEIYADRLECDYVIYGGNQTEISSAGIVSGGAGSDGIIATTEAGLGCLITGEIGHSSFHYVLESEIPVIVLGHYKSEIPGVLKMMEMVSATYDIECEFIDLPTGL